MRRSPEWGGTAEGRGRARARRVHDPMAGSRGSWTRHTDEGRNRARPIVPRTHRHGDPLADSFASVPRTLHPMTDLVYERNFEMYGLSVSHEAILAAVPRGSRVLDVGCASGYLGAELHRRKRC